MVAGDGTVQLSPEALAAFPPGTLFSVETGGEAVKLEAQRPRNAA